MRNFVELISSFPYRIRWELSTSLPLIVLLWKVVSEKAKLLAQNKFHRREFPNHYPIQGCRNQPTEYGTLSCIVRNVNLIWTYQPHSWLYIMVSVTVHLKGKWNYALDIHLNYFDILDEAAAIYSRFPIAYVIPQPLEIWGVISAFVLISQTVSNSDINYILKPQNQTFANGIYWKLS